MESPSLLIVGTVAYDKIKTPFASVDKILGGSAMYAGVAASFFDKLIAIKSIVGYDFDSKDLDWLKSLQIDISGINIHPTEKTFFWEGEYSNDMNNRTTLQTQLNVLNLFDTKLTKNMIQAPFVLMGNLSPTIQLGIVEQLSPKTFIALDTMNFWIDSQKEELLKVISKVNLVIINDAEARQLTQEYQLAKAAQQILKLGPTYVIIKKGEHGALLFDNKEMFYVAGLPLEEIYDPTGAGDTFAGGMLGYLIKSGGKVNFHFLKKAIVFGSAVASYCVQELGPQKFKNIQKADIQKRAQDLYELVKFEF